MTQNQEEAKLTPTLELEEQMAEITCAGCGRGHGIVYQGYDWGATRVNNGVIRGVLICHAPVKDIYVPRGERPCNAKSVFEITGNSVSFLPGKVSYGTLHTSIEPISTFYSQAEQCFFAGIPDGAAALCRASVEVALNQRGLKPDDSLYDKIEKAKALPKDPLTNVEVMLAHGSRIVAKDSIHQGIAVSLTDIPSMLSATVQIVNKLYP